MDHTHCKQHARQNKRPSQGPRRSYWLLGQQLFESVLSMVWTCLAFARKSQKGQTQCWPDCRASSVHKVDGTSRRILRKQAAEKTLQAEVAARNTELATLQCETQELQAEAAEVQQTIADSVANKPQKLSWPILMLSRCRWRRGSSATPDNSKHIARQGPSLFKASISITSSTTIKAGLPSLLASVVHAQEPRLSRSVIPVLAHLQLLLGTILFAFLPMTRQWAACLAERCSRCDPHQSLAQAVWEMSCPAQSVTAMNSSTRLSLRSCYDMLTLLDGSSWEAGSDRWKLRRCWSCCRLQLRVERGDRLIGTISGLELPAPLPVFWSLLVPGEWSGFLKFSSGFRAHSTHQSGWKR